MTLHLLKRAATAVLLVLLASVSAVAQTFTLNSTTLSAAATATQGTFTLTSASAATGSSFGSVAVGQYVFVDDEFAPITAVSSTTITVQRTGGGNRPNSHASGATVYIGPGYAFQRVNPPRGTCTTTANPSPWVNVNTGEVFVCATTFWAHPPRDSFPINVTASTVTLGRTHVGRIVTLNLAAGIAVTLPASSGSGDTYILHVGTTFTGASTVKVANATDVMQGTAILFADGGDTVVGFATASTSDTIDLLGTSNSTGGIVGETIILIDSASGFWSVRVVSDAGGTEATPFSATVS